RTIQLPLNFIRQPLQQLIPVEGCFSLQTKRSVKPTQPRLAFRIILIVEVNRDSRSLDGINQALKPILQTRSRSSRDVQNPGGRPLAPQRLLQSCSLSWGQQVAFINNNEI